MFFWFLESRWRRLISDVLLVSIVALVDVWGRRIDELEKLGTRLGWTTEVKMFQADVKADDPSESGVVYFERRISVCSEINELIDFMAFLLSVVA